MVQCPCSGVGNPRREVFLLHASAEGDTRFVHDVLLPGLPLAPDEVMLSSGLPPGRTMLAAVEHALATSHITVLVLSPAFLRETWSSCGELLASHHAVSGRGLLVPLMISDCELPARLEMWVRLDLRRASQRETELGRLRQLLREEHAARCPTSARREPVARADRGHPAGEAPLAGRGRPARPHHRLRAASLLTALAALFWWWHPPALAPAPTLASAKDTSPLHPLSASPSIALAGTLTLLASRLSDAFQSLPFPARAAPSDSAARSPAPVPADHSASRACAASPPSCAPPPTSPAGCTPAALAPSSSSSASPALQRPPRASPPSRPPPSSITEKPSSPTRSRARRTDAPSGGGSPAAELPTAHRIPASHPPAEQ